MENTKIVAFEERRNNGGRHKENGDYGVSKN
jgi:hypothetical protein